MKRLIIIFFCSILSIGKLETINDAEHIWQVNNDGMGEPIAEEHIFSMPGYHNIQDNNVRTEQRNNPTGPCLKHDNSRNVQPIVPSPSRRSFASESQKNPSTKIEPTNVQPQILSEDNTLRSINNNENYNPQLFNYEDRVGEIPYAQENSSTSKEDLVEDNVFEKTPSFDVTTSLVKEILPNQEIEPVLETAQYRSFNYVITEDQLNPTPTAVESSVHQIDDGCIDKKRFDGLAEPSRRFLLPANYNLPSPQTNTMKENNDLSSNKISNANTDPTHNLRASKSGANQLGDALNVYGRTVMKTHNLYSKNMNKSSQETNEDPGRAGSTNNMYSSNSDPQLKDPAQGEGISYMNKNTRKKVMDFDRVCYACSSVNNPTCLSPDRKTTVKYCRKGANACVTKTFGTESTLTLIRDCGKTCHDAEIPGITPTYKTCSICHTDLCNGSYSINVYSSILALPTIIIVVLVKPLLVFS